MKGKINKNGYLYIECAGKMEVQGCPFAKKLKMKLELSYILVVIGAHYLASLIIGLTIKPKIKKLI